jgi:branched-chain amino acid transport system substrate-binding protein
MDTMKFPPDMFGSAEATYSPDQAPGQQPSRLSQITDGRWKVISEYVKP